MTLDACIQRHRSMKMYGRSQTVLSIFVYDCISMT